MRSLPLAPDDATETQTTVSVERVLTAHARAERALADDDARVIPDDVSTAVLALGIVARAVARFPDVAPATSDDLPSSRLDEILRVAEERIARALRAGHQAATTWIELRLMVLEIRRRRPG